MSELCGSAPFAQAEPTSRQGDFLLRHRRALSGLALGLITLTGCSQGKTEHSTNISSAPAGTTEGSPKTTTGEIGTPATVQQINRNPLVPGSRHTEVRRYSSNDNPGTFADYHNLAIAGPRIPGYYPGRYGDEASSSVVVDCKLYDPDQAGNSTRGYYYHLIGWADGKPHESQGGDVIGFYSPANTYWNQPKPGYPDLNHPFDPDPTLPLCPGSPDLPPR